MKQKKKLMTISVDFDVSRKFKQLCNKYGLKMSSVLEQSMRTFNQTAKQTEEMKNERIN